MKFLLTFACLFVASNALDKEFMDKFIEEVRSVGDQCVAESSATIDDINNLIAHTIPASHEGKCLLFCFHKHFHLQNEDGSVDKPGAIKALDPLKEHDPEVYDKVLKVFTICGDAAAVDSDPCIYSSNLAECAVKEGKALHLDEVLIFE